MIPPTGSKYTTSILLRPWPRGWGWFFYFLDVMPMFCPYPTTCEWDAYRKTGVHFCNIGKCQYIMTAKVMLERERARLMKEKHLTERQKQTLEEIREQLRKLNAQFWKEHGE